MFKRIKLSIKRTIVFFLVLGAITLLVITLTNLYGDRLFSPKTIKLWIDADSGNGTDAVFALTRLLLSDELEIKGLSSAQWEFSQEANGKSLEISQEIHSEILRLLNKNAILHPPGSPEMIRSESGKTKLNSPAAEAIIMEIKSLKKKDKLHIVCFGSPTNVAAAIMLDPSITPRIRLFISAMKYNSRTRAWNKNEFNARNDLDALDYLLDLNELDLFILPENIADAMILKREDKEKFLMEDQELARYLSKTWDKDFQLQEIALLRDVALAEAILNPDMVKTEKVVGPPENNTRALSVYTGMNRELMAADLWAALHSGLKQKE